MCTFRIFLSCSLKCFSPYCTVECIPQHDKANAPPAIHLKGLWLKAAELEIGDSVTVKIMEGCLVLTPKAKRPTTSNSNTSASASKSVRLSCG
ncbi:SymE family type I addiction module toxin [Xenorhabdus santafensis]|uniref:SymE family type I addiction module toxin n=1 Tax=Xenorhabdus santafensis TaxID=2582833 RepID=UPI003F6CFEB5